MNNKKANYVVTGTWSDRAFKESLKFIKSYDSVKLNIDSIKIKVFCGLQVQRSCK